ncbi:TPM domain-containing protein [Candidatus Nitrospira bockiana]
MTRRARLPAAAPLVLLCAVLAIPGPLAATPPDRAAVPEPLGYVTDHAGVLDADWKARIRSVCQDLERKTGVEMVVVAVPNQAAFRSVADFASAVYQRWGVGSAQQEHGVVILAAIEERQAAVTVGKPLVGRLTQPVLEDIGKTYVDPAFRAGRYGEGLYRTTVALAAKVQDVRVGDPPRRHLKGLGVVLTVLTFLGAFVFLWWISRPDLRHPYRRLHRQLFWASGQGGFGGNFGGFGGGTGEGLK